MRNGRTCDVCGTLYVAYNPKSTATRDYNGIMLLNIDNAGKYYSHDAKDLCPECKAAFEAWIASRRV